MDRSGLPDRRRQGLRAVLNACVLAACIAPAQPGGGHGLVTTRPVKTQASQGNDGGMGPAPRARAPAEHNCSRPLNSAAALAITGGKEQTYVQAASSSAVAERGGITEIVDPAREALRIGGEARDSDEESGGDSVQGLVGREGLRGPGGGATASPAGGSPADAWRRLHSGTEDGAAVVGEPVASIVQALLKVPEGERDDLLDALLQEWEDRQAAVDVETEGGVAMRGDPAGSDSGGKEHKEIGAVSEEEDQQLLSMAFTYPPFFSHPKTEGVPVGGGGQTDTSEGALDLVRKHSSTHARSLST